MTGTSGGKEVKYNEMDLLILDFLGKDNPSVEGMEFADCFQADYNCTSAAGTVT